MNWTSIDIKDLKPNPGNPRKISKEKFDKLVKSIQKFPEMLELRPIVVNKNMEVLGGNMRLKACLKAGLKEVPVIKAEDLTEEQEKEFIIKDNVGFGEWDWEIINKWDIPTEWGLDVPGMGTDDKRYTTKVKSPLYEVKNEKPNINSLYDLEKYNSLVNEINASNLEEKEKEFLKICASRHIVFNYSSIADYYAHSEKETQLLMEKSALVIIDFKQAIDLGFVKLYEELIDIENGD